MSPHEAATMLGVAHTADAETIDAAIARLRVDYDGQIGRAVTPEIATYWRNRVVRLDEARDVLRKAAEARLQAEAEAAHEREHFDDGVEADEGGAFSGSVTPEAVRAEWERLQLPMPAERIDARPGLPWEASDAPMLERAIATVRLVLFEPSRAFSQMQRTGGLAAPLLFSLLVGLPATTVATYIYFLFQVAYNPQEFNNMGLREAAAVGVVVMPLYVAVVYPLSLFLNAGLQHLSLLLLEKSPQPFETTFRVVAYALGAASALQWVPVLGLLASGVAQILVNVVGLSRAHDLSTGRAALVFFLPMLTCCVCAVLLIMAGTWVGSSLTR